MVLKDAAAEHAFAAGAEVEGTVERFAHGGEGVAHVDGIVAFVPWTAPGDRVRARVVEARARWVRARPVEIVAPGPGRVLPGCPVFGACGGCQLQHVGREEQLAAKARAVEDALVRIGRLPLPEPVVCAPAAAPWHYRQRATFTWAWRAGELTLGFHAAAIPLVEPPPDGVVDVHACPIFAEAGNARLAPLRRALAQVLASRSEPLAGRLAVRALGPVSIACGVFAEDPALARELAHAAGAAARIPATWGRWSPGEPPLVAAEAPRLHARIAYRGLELRVGFDSFLQADLAAAGRLYDAVLEDVGAAARVVDGYAGVGVVTCELARRGVEVTAVESHPGAAADLRANAARVAATVAEAGAVHVLELPADRVDWGRARPEAIVVNPPRTGVAARALAAIARTRARRLVYVACDPATLARDLARLAPAWRLERVRAFDLFPQTAHVETVAVLTRSDRGGGA